MAKQGQIYVREFSDSIYVGQTDSANAIDQYNRASGHTAAACGVNVYGGQWLKGGTKWKKAELNSDLLPVDAKIKEVGLPGINYHTYDDISDFYPLVEAFHKVGFYSAGETQKRAVPTIKATLDIAEISLIYYYLTVARKKHLLRLNQEQGGKRGLKFYPEKSNWAQNLVSTLKLKGFKYKSSGVENLGKTKTDKLKSTDPFITLENDGLNKLLSNKKRPDSIQNQIKDYIKAVAKQYIYPYVQQQVEEAFALLYSGSRGINTEIDTKALMAELNKNDQLKQLENIIKNNQDNLSFNGETISIKITNLKTSVSKTLINRIESHYNNKRKRLNSVDILTAPVEFIKNDLIKFLNNIRGKVRFTYDIDISLDDGYFTWDPTCITSEIEEVAEKKTSGNSDSRKYSMVYGVCFAICHYIYIYRDKELKGPVLTVDGQGIAVRHPYGKGKDFWYSSVLLSRISNRLPIWVQNNWRHYYDAAMALYHSAVHSSQMVISSRDSKDHKFTNRYYFSNLDLNSFNAEDYSGLSGFKHLQTKKEGSTRDYGGNYYYKVKSGSIFELIDAKNKFGDDYLWRCYNELYKASVV